MKTLFDLSNQTVAVGRNPHHRRSKLIPEQEQPMKTLFDDVTNVLDVFVKGMQLSGDGQCLGWRPTPTQPYSWLKYSEVLQRAKNLGASFVHQFGLRTEPETFVGIYSKNRPEWIITEQACYTYRMALVPIYDTLGKEACQLICSQTEMRVVVCDSNARIMSLLQLREDLNGSMNAAVVNTIILAGVDEPSISSECRARAAAVNVNLYTLQEVEAIGAAHPHEPVRCLPEDLATICYTSGTTGMPKGAMITHANIVATVSALQIHLGVQRLAVKDSMISFLPLAHMFEFACEHTMFLGGGSVGYYAGEILKLTDDMRALKPTLVVAVPRLLNRIYDTVHAKTAASKVKSAMLRTACFFKGRYVDQGIITNSTIWDKVVFKAVQDSFGGCCRLLVSGSAPLHESILQFIRCALGCVVVEGYGQTENSAPCTATIWGDHVPGQTGPPLVCNEVKLVDVPEMSIDVERDGRGEICIHGTNVFAGYYKAPEKTAEVLDADGWLHTGDIGLWTEAGTLKIVDRRKNMFKLAQGEYVVPDKIEAAYMRHPLVDQMYLYGEPLKSCCVALIVPNQELLIKLAKDNNIPITAASLSNGEHKPSNNNGSTVAVGNGSSNNSGGDATVNYDKFVGCCDDAVLTKKVLEVLNQYAKKSSSLQSFELAKALRLLHEPFTVDNGLLTPTMKSKRHDIKQRYYPLLQEMYAETDRQYQQTRTEKDETLKGKL